jgi:hypothetical protein
MTQVSANGGILIAESAATPVPGATPNVLILTPLKDARHHLHRYVENLEAIEYPRQYLSIGLLESDSRDDTWAALEGLLPRLQARCCRVTVIKRDFNFRLPPGVPRWTTAFQRVRRSVLARSRNQLLFRSLQDEDWVLWLDVDVVSYPRGLIGQLLAFNLDILHPHCVQAPGGPTFDRNGWADHGRKLLEDFRGANEPVRLDAVGATILLVKADCHRDGLIFPPFPYGLRSEIIRPANGFSGAGEIESEGLGVLAQDLGYQCWGIPDLEVLHAPD